MQLMMRDYHVGTARPLGGLGVAAAAVPFCSQAHTVHLALQSGPETRLSARLAAVQLLERSWQIPLCMCLCVPWHFGNAGVCAFVAAALALFYLHRSGTGQLRTTASAGQPLVAKNRFLSSL